MKILLTIIVVFVSVACFAQPTTQDEYNYLTKGLKRTLEEGGDAKGGYTLSEPSAYVSGPYEISFAGFVKQSTNAVSAISCVVKSSVSGNTYYLCLPLGNETLLNSYFADIAKWDSALQEGYAAAFTMYMLTALEAAKK
jgi:hypothetical protein